MKEAEIPDFNLFMIAASLNIDAVSKLPEGFTIRNCRRDEFSLWKSFPFDNPSEAKEYDSFMLDYFNTTYKAKEAEFYNRTLFVCDPNDHPVGTCMIWKAYGEFNTIQWFKVLKEVEGKGIGRALFSVIMEGLSKEDYPIYLHTQASSFRAIKLYSDFGFEILTDEQIGSRRNEIKESLPILKAFMPQQYFDQLKFRKAPKSFIEKMKAFKTNQF